MRISGSSLTESTWQLYQKNQTSGAQGTTFNDLLRTAKSAVQNAAAAGSIPKAATGSIQEGEFGDPYFRIWFDYKEWKRQQPERVLPDSQGATEENLAYLRENFAGELSLFQRIEAVDTMREMGIITEKQMDDVLGLNIILVEVPMSGPWITTTPLETGRNAESSFSEHPLINARYLDDLFELLDRLLRDDTEDDIGDDLQEAFDRVKQAALKQAVLQ